MDALSAIILDSFMICGMVLKLNWKIKESLKQKSIKQQAADCIRLTRLIELFKLLKFGNSLNTTDSLPFWLLLVLFG